MAEATLTPLNIDQHMMFKYTRTSFRVAGIDVFTQPPAQNEDTFMQALNILPPMTGVFMRRWAYGTFYPKLDSGSGDSV
jgi:hypothetical protein